MSSDSEKENPTEKKFDKDDLIKRFKSSDLYIALSQDDRAALMKGIENDDEITIKELDRLLTQQELLNDYFEQQSSLMIEDVVSIATMTCERTDRLLALKEAADDQQALDSESADKLLN